MLTYQSTLRRTQYGRRCWVAAYEIVSRVGSQVEFEAVLRVDGRVAKGVF